PSGGAGPQWGLAARRRRSGAAGPRRDVRPSPSDGGLPEGRSVVSTSAPRTGPERATGLRPSGRQARTLSSTGNRGEKPIRRTGAAGAMDRLSEPRPGRDAPPRPLAVSGGRRAPAHPVLQP